MRVSPRAVRYRESDLFDFIDARTVSPPPRRTSSPEPDSRQTTLSDFVRDTGEDHGAREEIENLRPTPCHALRGPEAFQPSCDLPLGHAGPHRWGSP